MVNEVAELAALEQVRAAGEWFRAHEEQVSNWQLALARVPADVNRLSNQVLVQTFEEEWGRVQR